MAGPVVLGLIVVAMLGPTLLATMIADLTRFQLVALLTVGVLIGGTIAIRNSDVFQEYYWDWTMPASRADEAAFVAAAERLHAVRVAYAQDDATAAKVHQAESAICAMPATATGWVGRISQKYLADSDRGETLAVEIRPHVVVRTAFFPDATRTLIPAGSPAFDAVQAMQPGEAIRFDGRIVGHAGACPDDPPIDRNEKLRDPEFLFRFSRIVRATTR